MAQKDAKGKTAPRRYRDARRTDALRGRSEPCYRDVGLLVGLR
jgi:hypothetical protein